MHPRSRHLRGRCARAATEALVDALDGRRLRCAGGRWLATLQEKARRNEESARQVLTDDSIPINPYRVVAEVRDVVPRDAIVTSEGETIMGIARAMMPAYVNRSCFNAGTTGCMGVGAPYVVGAALASPGSPLDRDPRRLRLRRRGDGGRDGDAWVPSPSSSS
ncbi:MAG: hypothetical protein R3E53_10960 [Myxococcota bacterium]